LLVVAALTLMVVEPQVQALAVFLEELQMLQLEPRTQYRLAVAVQQGQTEPTQQFSRKQQ
jgi:hypothetical protein